VNGADAILRCLEAEGVDVMFGLPGGAILPLYDAIARGTTVRHVLARHEQGAGHMAEGYARASGRVGVAIATSGPGATNLVTPIADAWMDSTPLVCITGQVRSFLIGTDAFQECDITGITIPIVKHSWLVQDVEELPHTLKAAFHVARTGRCGPVLVDVPRDIHVRSRPLLRPSPRRSGPSCMSEEAR
jgi:acetolactate synthase-1/2/3 large subunit